MRIAKPLLLVSTPLGIVTGLIEAYRLVGGLAILMFAMMAMLGVAAAGVVYTIRKEKKEWTASKSSS
jgi:predicted exporter